MDHRPSYQRSSSLDSSSSRALVIVDDINILNYTEASNLAAQFNTRLRSYSDSSFEQSPALSDCESEYSFTNRRSRSASEPPKSTQRSPNKSRSSIKSNNEPASPPSASYNIYDKKVSRSLQDAWDYILGAPFRGAIAYIGIIEKKGARLDIIQSKMDSKPRFSGEHAQVDLSINIQEIQGKKFNITVKSAGYDDGNFAEILLNAENLCKDERGLNICFIDPVTSNTHVESFDTFSVNGPEEIERLEAFINAQFQQTNSKTRCMRIVCLAVKDDCSKNLKQKGYELLSRLGLDLNPRDSADQLNSLISKKLLIPEKAPSLLNLCSKANAHRCIQLLVDNGWRIDYRPKHGLQNTALHDAVFHGSAEAIHALILKGANTAIRNKMGETAEDMIRNSFKMSVEEFMIWKGSVSGVLIPERYSAEDEESLIASVVESLCIE